MSCVDDAVQGVSVTVPMCEVGKTVPASVRERVRQILADDEMTSFVCSMIESGTVPDGVDGDEAMDFVRWAHVWLDWHGSDTKIGDFVHCLDTISCG